MLNIVIVVKSDTSLLFRKLKELNILHRIILTGVRAVSSFRQMILTILQDSVEQQYSRVVQLDELLGS